ncbi:MAG: hypothetical protein IJC88_03475 [Oscillospiraceae bacterium]|nr:hypothetical protein [Oscillospiraceae bacterium]
MWETWNFVLAIFEVIFAGMLVFAFVKKSRLGKVAVVGIFLLNVGLYLLPLLYARIEQGVEMSLTLGIWECISATIKQLVGEVRTEAVVAYASVYPSFLHPFGFGAALALAASFYLANSVFGSRITNAFRCWFRMNGKTCDLVCGNKEDILCYAQHTKQTILLLDEETPKEVMNGLLEDGYVILKKRFSAKLLKSRMFNSHTDYNFILLNDGTFLDYINIISQYVHSGAEEKNIRIYVETDTSMNDVVQNELTCLLDSMEDKERCAEFREAITLFSRNELIARKLVEQHPITKYLPKEFLCEDASIAPDCRMQAVFLGMTQLSREIYKQFVINHQFAVWDGGEYRALPLSYDIYAKTVRSSEWEFGGLGQALEECEAERSAYFPLPEMPYHTTCHNENPLLVDLDEIVRKLRAENCYSVIFIDVGNSCKNLELANRLKLLLRETTGYHLFVCDTVSKTGGDAAFTEYGNIDDILQHDVIVDESLTALAKSINRNYYVSGGACDGFSEEQIVAFCNMKWYGTPHFKRYSNVSAANNLRLKLNLLGLDYVKDGKGTGIKTLRETLNRSDTTKGYEGYFERNVHNSLLAQEHLRWNAYHLMNGYLPMKRKDLIVCESDKENPQNKKEHIYENHQSESLRLHACLTDYLGLKELSGEIARRAGEIYRKESFSHEDYDFYKNDGMLLSIVADVFELNGISVVNRA